MIIKALLTGLGRTLRNPRILFFYFITNWIAGYLITIPFRKALESTAGYSSLIDRFASGLDFNLLMELFQTNLGLWSSTFAIAFSLGLLYLIIGIFYSGGAFEALSDGSKGIGFWAASAKHFWIFFRIHIWTLPFVVLSGLVVLIANFVKKLVIGDDPLQSTAFWAGLVVLGIAFICLLFITLIIDIARARIVYEQDNQAVRAVLEAFVFVKKHPIMTWGYILLILFVSGIGGICFKWIGDVSGLIETGPATGLLIISQTYILFRLVMRLTRYGGIIYLFESSQPREEPEVWLSPVARDIAEPLVTLET